MAKDKKGGKGTAKTNAVRLLERAGVHFGLHEYPVDEEHLEAQHVADELGQDINRVFKTIVLKGERTGHFVCVVPGNSEIDLKKAARAAGDKKADLIHVKELLGLTGYIRGGCSPVGMKKEFPTYIDETAMLFDAIAVSGGMRGVQLIINPDQLLGFVKGEYVDLTA